jgi:hypothetical protein
MLILILALVLVLALFLALLTRIWHRHCTWRTIVVVDRAVMIAIVHTGRVLRLAAFEVVSLMLVYVSLIVCVAIKHTRVISRWIVPQNAPRGRRI